MFGIIIYMDNPFSNTGFSDVMVGAELYKAVGLKPYEFSDPIQSAKIKEIADFLNGHPDPSYVLKNVPRKNKSPNMSNLDYLLSYVKLNKEKQGLMSQLEDVDKSLRYY